MGNFYTNIVLKGAPREAVIERLRKLKREAFVSPAEGDVTVVYDSECEEQDFEVLFGLASRLTRQLHCVGLSFLNHDDDVLACGLFRRGKRVTDWVWDPTGFLEGGLPSASPRDFAAAVAAACGCDTARFQAALEQAVRPPMPSQRARHGVFAFQVHHALVKALGFGRYAVPLGYRYVRAGDAKEFVGSTKGFTEVALGSPPGTEGAGRSAARRTRAMFSYYTSLALRFVDQGAVLRLLEELGRHAFVSPIDRGFIVVCDERCESHDLAELDGLAKILTERLQCSAIAFLNHNEDRLVCSLFREGDLAGRYVWGAEKGMEGQVEVMAAGRFASAACAILQTGMPAGKFRNSLRDMEKKLAIMQGRDSNPVPMAFIVNGVISDQLRLSPWCMIGYRQVAADRASHSVLGTGRFAEVTGQIGQPGRRDADAT